MRSSFTIFLVSFSLLFCSQSETDSKNRISQEKNKNQKTNVNSRRSKNRLVIIKLKQKKTDLKEEILRIETEWDLQLKALFNRDLQKTKTHFERLEKKSGKKLLNPELYFKVQSDNVRKLNNLIFHLQSKPFIEKAYLYPKLAVSQILETPDLSPVQNHHNILQTDTAHQEGYFGNEITIVNFEYDWNILHEDLNLNPDSYLNESLCQIIEDENCNLWKAHGTAIAGLIQGQDNNHGILGVSPEAKLYIAPVHFSFAEAIIPLIDGIEDYNIKGGSIFVVPLQALREDEITCGLDHRHCLPLETIDIDRRLMNIATEMGLTVMISAGNTGQNLDEIDDIYPLEEESSALMVTASSFNRRLYFSNCGQAVDFNAPGLNLITSSFPFNESPYFWENPNERLLPENNNPETHYVSNFSGSSASVALTAGVAALLQNKFSNEFGQGSYLKADQIRNLMNESDNQVDCSIGSSVNTLRSFERLNNFLEEIRDQFPEIGLHHSLSHEQVLRLEESGIELICNPRDIKNSSPLCPENHLFPIGFRRAKKMDITGNGHAELFHYHQNIIRIHSYDNGFQRRPNYKINIPELSAPNWPFLEDINRDGRVDLVLFEKLTGRFFVKYTTNDFLRNRWWQGENDMRHVDDPELWDEIIHTRWRDEYFENFTESNYSRPLFADYNQDGWVDLALMDSNGLLNIKWNQNGFFGDIDEWDESHRYLDEATLAISPAYNFIPTVIDAYDQSPIIIGIKIPESDEASFIKADYQRMGVFDDIDDLLFDRNRLLNGEEIKNAIKFWTLTPSNINGAPYSLEYLSFTHSINTYTSGFSGIYSSNEIENLENNPLIQGSPKNLAIKRYDGSWEILVHRENYQHEEILITPPEIFCNLSCHPFTADFDGDGIHELATLSPMGVGIYYSQSRFNFEDVLLNTPNDFCAPNCSTQFNDTDNDGHIDEIRTRSLREIRIYYRNGTFYESLFMPFNPNNGRALPGTSYYGGIRPRSSRFWNEFSSEIGSPRITTDMVLTYSLSEYPENYGEEYLSLEPNP